MARIAALNAFTKLQTTSTTTDTYDTLRCAGTVTKNTK